MKAIPSTFLCIALWISAASALSAPKPKRIICSFDGSGCSPLLNNPNEKDDRALTNVLKLHVLAGGSFDGKTHAVPNQICLYEKGVAGYSRSTILRTIRMIRGDLDQQIEPMKKKLEAVYEEGDELYVIGYSRGAAAARTFVSDLDRDGVATSRGAVKPRVRMLGCFDTVALQLYKNSMVIFKTALKDDLMTSDVLGEDGKLGDIVDLAVQNLSLDDARFKSLPSPFSPIFMDTKDSRVHETWFAGDHSDIGGNYFRRGLVDASCNHMREWLSGCGVTFLDPTSVTDEALTDPDHPSEVEVGPDDLRILPRTDQEAHIKEDQKSLRPVVAASKDAVLEGHKVRVHKSVLDHLVAMEKAGTPYQYNGNLKHAKFDVIGSFDNILAKETEELEAILKLTEGREFDDHEHEATEEEAEQLKLLIEAMDED
jgi:hypothetical protein